MKIFIDFDDVIFNTKQFKEDLKKVFSDFGIPEQIYDQTYYAPDDERAVKVYDPRAQVARIQKKVHVDAQKMLEAINAFMQENSKYVFPDFFEFLEAAGRDNVYVLSYGDVGFQNEKITSCGIDAFLRHIIVTPQMKSVAICEIIQNEAFLFLDDRIEQIRDVKEKFPEAITFLIKRPQGRYQDMYKENCCDHEAKNLKDVQEIIFNN